MKVCKFGGSSVANAEQVSKIVDIVLADNDRRIVVVSAPGKRDADDTKVTDLLIECAEKALAGADYESIFTQILERYAEIQRDLELADGIIAEIEKDLRFRLGGEKSHKGMFMDCMKAAGEDNSAKIVAQAFQARGADAVYVDPHEAGMFLTDDFGNAQLLDESIQHLHKVLTGRDDIVIFPGFFGYTRDGRVATFPRGGSDITGSILAVAVNADSYENFTDVDAVYPVDPRVVPDVKKGIAAMTYREMRELSYAGFGVFHDEAVIPAVKAGVPINVRNTNRPEEPGTVIMQSRRVEPGTVVGIASADGFCNLYVDKYMMNREIGFGRRLLQILEEEHVSYEHMPSGIDNVSVVLCESDFDKECEARVIKRIYAEMNPDDVMVQRDHAMVMVVGEGMHYTVGLAAKATAALASSGVNVEMMNQGSSEISMVFGVKSDQRVKAVQALYKAFF
ncbi:MAG: aspartate kinase [Kiritimatiellae bacterium]|jgi:aspartate kinase|nr:aspartate kinase [Kiritimatiellia bacterium]